MVRRITIIVDFILTQLHVNSTSKTGKSEQRGHLWALQLFFLLVNTTLSVWPMICYFVVTNNIHILFWLGTFPHEANLLVPITLFGVAFSMTFFFICGVNAKTAKKGALLLFTLGGLLLIGSGAYVFYLAHTVSSELIFNCGATPLTAHIQKEWQALADFYDKCAERLGERPPFIQQCPGFTASFDQVYVEYIEDMEIDYDCQGFCNFWAQAFFNKDSEPGRRCASVIGEDVHHVGMAVGLPIMGVGGMMIVLGGCLAGYDHL